MKRLLILTSMAILVAGAVFIKIDSGLYDDVKSGEMSLYCIFEDGERVVDPDYIEGFDPEYGWTFFNGSAKNCRVE